MTVRTLHLINGLGTGGAERSLAELLPELPKHGVEPAVGVLKRSKEGVEAAVRALGIEVHLLDGDGWIARIRSLRSLLRRIDADVLHTAIFEADVMGRAAAACTRTKVLTSLVNTSYDPIRLCDPGVNARRLQAGRLVDSVSGRFLTDHFHAISHAVKDAAIRQLRFPCDRITVVPRGRKRSRLGEPSLSRRLDVRRRLDIPLEAFVVLHVGREEYQKAHRVLLDAVTPILGRRSDIHLVLAGRRGNSSGEVDERLGRRPPSRIHRLGHTDSVPDLLAAADLFVFPSLYEGLGGAALEAMALEVPMIVSDIPALRELFAGVARFVPPGDVHALGAAVDRAINLGPDPAATALGRSRFDRCYEHGVISKQMADLFRSLT